MKRNAAAGASFLVLLACVLMAACRAELGGPRAEFRIVGGRTYLSDCHGPFKNKALTQTELTEVLRIQADWFAEYKKNLQTERRRPNLCMSDLSRLDLSDANLMLVDLQGADLRWANLIGANLVYAILSDADLRHVRIDKAKLNGAIVTRTRYEPEAGSTPELQGIAEAVDLKSLRWENSPSGLVALQQLFKSGGFRRQEREVTYAIKRSEFSLRYPDKTFRVESPVTSELDHPNQIESLFSFVLFDLTSQYGMSPGRPLRIIGTLIPLFALIYLIAVRRKSGSGIWVVWPDSSHRLPRDKGLDQPMRVHRKDTVGLAIAVYFSVLSAFNIGWREVNIGNWIARLQPQDYSLQATGWTRSVAGAQSLVSVYLLALWVLTYFGRPFE